MRETVNEIFIELEIKKPSLYQRQKRIFYENLYYYWGWGNSLRKKEIRRIKNDFNTAHYFTISDNMQNQRRFARRD